jgi:hypothetical protein
MHSCNKMKSKEGESTKRVQENGSTASAMAVIGGSEFDVQRHSETTEMRRGESEGQTSNKLPLW